MWYLLHENDQKRYVKENSKYFVTVFDYTTKTETLCVYFTPQDNGRVLMKTKYPLTYMYADKKKPASNDAYYSFPHNREVVLLSDSVETPRISVRMVKLDPTDWPAPPPEDIARAPTLSYDAVVVAAPLPVDPPPPPLPAQEQKKNKKRRREFHMW